MDYILEVQSKNFLGDVHISQEAILYLLPDPSKRNICLRHPNPLLRVYAPRGPKYRRSTLIPPALERKS